ncbi:hypothetical protein E2562_003713, partial [Oryza meyeriana var. granulata]
MDWSNASDHFHRRVKAVLAGALLAEPEGGNGKTNTLFDATNLDVDCPGSPLVLHVLGHVRAALGEADAALDPLRRARDLAPGNLDIAFTLAKTYAAREQFDLAAEECKRALSLGDADLVDPELHAVFESRHLEPSKEARISIAKQPLRELLADTSSKIVVLMARDCWNGMSEEVRRSFLTVKADVEIMQLDAEVDKLKKKLVEVCTCDYREIILPAMKDYLWAKLCNDPPENVLRSKDDAEANTENRVSVQEDINASLNISTSGIVLQEDDEKGAKDNPKGGDSTVPHDNVVEELPGDNKVLQSGQKLELPPRANENTLGSSQNTPMEKENKTSSPSDYSGSIEEDANISSNGVTGTAYPNSENELKSLYATLLSLWHLRPFSDEYMKKAHLFPHFGVSGEDCMLCGLFHTFSAFSDKNDSRATYRLKCLRASLIKFFNGANVSLKEETNLAVKFTEVIFNMVHTSETATRVSKNSEKILYKTTLFSICHDHGCLSHGLFGMHKNAREITYFLNLGASELQNIETKSFAGVIKSVDKQFHCNIESNAHNDPPRFFTTAFSYPSENDSQLDVSGLLLSFAAPWDINPVYEGLHSECKYTMVSAVFRAEGQDICFARVEEKWLVYDKTLVAVK